MPYNKRSFFLAVTAIELALLVGYGRSQYTGNYTNVLNTTVSAAPPARKGGRAGELRCHALSLPSEQRAVGGPRVARPAARRRFPMPSGRPLR